MHKMELSDLIAEATTPAFLQTIPPMTREQCVDFINALTTQELHSALEDHDENPFFILSLGLIYLKAGATKSFPSHLIELIYCHIIKNDEQRDNGGNLFMTELARMFNQSRISVSRSLWGLCSNSPADLESFLTEKNASPRILYYWLQFKMRSESPVTKQLHQIFERIKKKPLEYIEFVGLMIRHKTQLIFNSETGYFVYLISNRSVIKLLTLFEIDWEFTFGELTVVRNFLRNCPINAQYLYGEDISVSCSRNLIGNVMGLSDCLDEVGLLDEDTFFYNVCRFHEFVHLSHSDLDNVFQLNKVKFDIILTPARYPIEDVFLLFHNMFLRRVRLFTLLRILDSIKIYGNKLSPDEINSIPDALDEINDDRKEEAPFWLALMCYDRQESIPILDDYILLFKCILTRTSGDTIRVNPSSPANFQLIISNLRKYLPDFALQMNLKSVSWIENDRLIEVPILPVLATVEPTGMTIMYLNENSRLFPVMLQFLILSKTKAELWDKIVPVFTHIDQMAQQLPPNDVTFMMILAEMFNVIDFVFKKLDVSETDFGTIYELMPNHPENSIYEAFIVDPRFRQLAAGIHEERKVAELEKRCQEHSSSGAEQGSIVDSQMKLGVVLIECVICTSKSTPKYTDMLSPCGHTFCHGCSLKLTDCPNCRIRIKSRISLGNFGIKFRNPESSAVKRKREE